MNRNYRNDGYERAGNSHGNGKRQFSDDMEDSHFNKKPCNESNPDMQLNADGTQKTTKQLKKQRKNESKAKRKQQRHEDNTVKRNLDQQTAVENNDELALKYDCQDCDFRAISLNRLREHKKEAHLNMPVYYCDYDNCTFKTFVEWEVDRHVSKSHLCVAYSFEAEREKYKDRNTYPKRKLLKPEPPKGPRQFNCTYDGCSAKCHTEHTLKYHVDCVHLGLNVGRCFVMECPYSNTDKGAMAAHHRECHSDVPIYRYNK